MQPIQNDRTRVHPIDAYTNKPHYVMRNESPPPTYHHHKSHRL